MPKELTPGESRVALAPHAVHELIRAGHRVLAEAGVGLADALNTDDGLARGVVAAEGRVVHRLLARATDTEHNYLSSVLPLHSDAR